MGIKIREPIATATTSGLVPVPPNNTTTFLRGDATFATPAASGGPIKGYAATLTNVSNTSAATNTLTFTTSASDIADGDIIIIQFAALWKNNKGTAGTATFKLLHGVTSATLVNGVSVATAVAEGRGFFSIRMQRVGANLWISNSLFANAAQKFDGMNQWQSVGDWSSDEIAVTDRTVVMSSPTFTSGVTVALELTLNAASVDFYFKPQVARVYKIAAT